MLVYATYEACTHSFTYSLLYVNPTQSSASGPKSEPTEKELSSVCLHIVSVLQKGPGALSCPVRLLWGVSPLFDHTQFSAGLHDYT